MITRATIARSLKSLGVRHRQVAEAVGVGRSTVTLWLKGDISSPMLDRAIPAFLAGMELMLDLDRIKK